MQSEEPALRQMKPSPSTLLDESCIMHFNLPSLLLLGFFLLIKVPQNYH